MIREKWNKVKTHIFKFDGDLVALDIYRGRPFLIEPLDRAILRIRAPFDEKRALDQLGKRFSARDIEVSIQKLLSWKLLLPESQSLPKRPNESDFHQVILLELNIAEDCNLRCTYCCVSQGSFGADQGNGRARRFMNWDVARRSIDLLFEEALEASGVHIRFFGGEALMNWPIIKRSVPYAKEKARRMGKQVGFSTITNGTLLDKHMIDFMRENNFLVQISIDGTPEMHNAFRVDTDGNGTYEQATKYVSQLLETLGPGKVTARATITHFRPDVLEAFNHLRELGFESPATKPVTGQSPAYAMRVKDYLQVNKDYSMLARRVLDSQPHEAHQYFNPFIYYIPMLMSGEPRRPPCEAARTMIGIAVDGTIYPCTDMVGKEQEVIRLGDVYSGLRRDKKQKFLDIVDVDNKTGCRKCWARYVCGGACASTELSNEGGLEQNAGLECIWIRHMIELSLWLYVKMRADRPELFYELYTNDSEIDLGPINEILGIGE